MFRNVLARYNCVAQDGEGKKNGEKKKNEKNLIRRAARHG